MSEIHQNPETTLELLRRSYINLSITEYVSSHPNEREICIYVYMRLVKKLPEWEKAFLSTGLK